MVSPPQKDTLEGFLNLNGIDYKVAIKNIQEIIDKETVKTYNRNSRSMTWDAYYTLSDIENWMSDIARVHSTVVTEIVGGESYEGRPIKGLKISHGPGRQVIFIESGIHSREWITMTTTCYIINELLTSNDEETKAAARDFDWYIFPVTNPDGYVWTHTEFRLWRKNRKPYGNEVGVDLNRNWNNNWLVIGASTNPASNNFVGYGPFSEPETRTLSEYIRSIDNIEMYISFHSAGQILLIPFGNTTEPLANYHDALKIGRRAMGALSVRHGTQYTSGNIAEAIYHAAGTSIDWVKAALEVPLVYCYELRDRHQYGHLLPADQILPNNQEVMDSLIELIHQGKRFGYFNDTNVVRASLLLTSLLVFNEMKILKSYLFSFALFISLVSSDKVRFDNYTLYKITPKGSYEKKLLQDLKNSDVKYDFFNVVTPVVDYVNIMTSPDTNSSLESFLKTHGIHYRVTIQNVQDAINKQSIKSYTRNSRNMSWDAYYTLNDIEAWMSDMAQAYSSVATEVVGGTSYEGRQIKGLKISRGGNKKAIFIEAGACSREWITVATACYIINELLTSDDNETKVAVTEFDWYIFPVTNPDGYVWSHESFRLWRKNRRPIGSAFGVNLNRNWNGNWLVEGSSTNPSADNYAGTAPFSELETRTLSDYIKSIRNIEMYLAFHSYGQILMIPFGNTTQHLANYQDAVNIGRRAMGALSVRYGTQYVTGNTAEVVHLVTGTSIDWVKENLKVPLVYGYELRDKGEYAFLLPTDQILPNNQEVMDSVLELIHQGKRFGYFNSGNILKSSILTMSFCFILTNILW
ncbi:zinc carboxypeptidase A 1-like [Hyposmocoma kahamanoa]|uniref:zinc carboxypeptidase A 1-like n=1 Tax=Hyposmocoma kahamanoa TaxID=1477025 RepID=UPI000E6D87D8|nr:zinc carboxypeptidase A 1-like [Hyposmocoma kahamanoa]